MAGMEKISTSLVVRDIPVELLSVTAVKSDIASKDIGSP
jgi:hypothetical protein